MISAIEPKPFHELRYLNASRRGRAESARLPFHRGRAAMPRAYDAIVIASDLQGMTSPGWGEPAALLGVAVARAIEELDLGRVLTILAGDLYSVPLANKRGGFGDVSSVWEAFAEFAVHVVGVAGNHDDVANVHTSSRVHLLDGDVVTLDETRIGGVGLIAGDAAKPGRRDEDAQLEKLYDALDADVVVLHEGPHVGPDHEGSLSIADALREARVSLVVSGHCAWADPLVRLSERTQCLNVHERVIVLAT